MGALLLLLLLLLLLPAPAGRPSTGDSPLEAGGWGTVGLIFYRGALPSEVRSCLMLVLPEEELKKASSLQGVMERESESREQPRQQHTATTYCTF